MGAQRKYPVFQNSLPRFSTLTTLKGDNGGNFTLPDNARFRFQHDVRAAAGSVTDTCMDIHLYDNNNNDQTIPLVPSSGLELHLDLTNYNVALIRRLQDPEDLISTTHTGYRQTLSLSGHALMDYGTPPIMKEFNSAGDVVYSAQFGTRNVGNIYRGSKYEWDASPTTVPKVVASNSTGSTEVWISWNGATAVASWVLYAGMIECDLVEVMQVNRDGYFETHIALDSVYRYVRVYAKAANGTQLARSGIVAL